MSYTISKVVSVEEEIKFAELLDKHLYDPGGGSKKIEWFYKNSIIPGEMFLLSKNGVVVGTKGYGYREFMFGGKKYLGAISADITVEKEHRTLKPALMLNKHTMEMLDQDVDFHYAVPMDTADGLYRRRSGFKKIGRFNRYVKPLNLGVVVEAKLGNKKIFRTLGNSLNSIWLPLISIKRICNERKGMIGEKNVENAITNMWVDPNIFSGINTYEYINWRFSRNPLKNYEILSFSDGDNYGTVSFEKKENRAHISHISSSGPEVLVWILIELEKYCLSKKYDAIVIGCIDNELYRNIFSKLWYRRYTPTNNLWVSDNLDIPSSNYLFFTGDLDS